jgi:hypothetical protein
MHNPSAIRLYVIAVRAPMADGSQLFSIEENWQKMIWALPKMTTYIGARWQLRWQWR